MRLLWAFGVESRQTSVVLHLPPSPVLKTLRALTGGSRPPILRLHSDKASEFLSPPIRAYLAQQGVRQTVNSGYDPQANGLAERWIGIVKVRATALLADVRLPPEYWSYACRWVAYVHTHPCHRNTHQQDSTSFWRRGSYTPSIQEATLF